MIDFQQLFLLRVAAQFLPVLHHLGRKIPSDSGQCIECGGVSGVNVQEGYVNVFFQSRINAVRHDERLGEIFFPAEPAAFLPVPVDGFRLLERKAQAA